MKLTKKRIAIVVLAAVVVAGVTWALTPLFIETQADVPAPSGFATVVREGTWRGVDDFHFASGVAKILTNGEGDYVLRLEDFRIRNGPDIHFFLSADRTVEPVDVDLGTVPATSGNYNVPLPRGVDEATLGYALVHCVPANFLFASALLA